MAQFITTEQQTTARLRPQYLKPECLTIEADSSDNKWIIFQDERSRYEQITLLTNPIDIRNVLGSACSSSVNEMLSNFFGPEALKNSTEQHLLKYIKPIAVKSVHPEVYNSCSLGWNKSDGETIIKFVFRLNAKAMLCAFQKNIGYNDKRCITSCFEDMIKSPVMVDMRITSHQRRILAEIFWLPTLND